MERLAGCSKDRSTLGSLLIRHPDETTDEDGDEIVGDIIMSVAQEHRAITQTLAVFNYFKMVNNHYPDKDLIWCADEAAENVGFVVTGRTVWSWGREVSLYLFFIRPSPDPYPYSIYD